MENSSSPLLDYYFMKVVESDSLVSLHPREIWLETGHHIPGWLGMAHQWVLKAHLCVAFSDIETKPEVSGSERANSGCQMSKSCWLIGSDRL